MAAAVRIRCGAESMLSLNIDKLELDNKRARSMTKGGTIRWIQWQFGTAPLLPRLIGGRAPVGGRSSPTAGRRLAAAVTGQGDRPRGLLGVRAEMWPVAADDAGLWLVDADGP